MWITKEGIKIIKEQKNKTKAARDLIWKNIWRWFLIHGQKRERERDKVLLIKIEKK